MILKKHKKIDFIRTFVADNQRRENKKLHTDLYHTIALMQTPLVGDKTARTLIAHCGSAKKVFETSKKDLSQIPSIGLTIANSVKKFDGWNATDAEMIFIEKQSVKPAIYHENSYPARLKHFDDSPTILYKKGDWDANLQERIVGIIGTRKPSIYGRDFTEKLVEELQNYNVTIASGLAYGIDVTAHRAALEHNIPTVGVLAHGLNRIYPPAHLKTAERMWQEGGALLTELPSYTPPDRENFPRRNRIVAGLCDALVVAETAQRGGSMITATIAQAYYKDVFALPGRTTDAASAGCNYLIKKQQASLIENAEDLANIMSWEPINAVKQAAQIALFQELNPEEQTILTILRESGNKSLDIDVLTFKAQIPASRLAAILLSMEFNGSIQSLPGKRYAVR